MVKLVGILNITPDSFSDGGDYVNPTAAIARAEALFQSGAALVDVGAESTRPGATALAWQEEWRRLEPVLTVLIPKYPGKISLDSYHPETIRTAFAIGPIIVNDVSGLNSPAMLAVVAELKPTVIVSHLPEADIQKAHQTTPITDVQQVKHDLLVKDELLRSYGLQNNQIILDPGIGFGKTPEVNRQLLRFAELVPKKLVMIGYSRKRFLDKHRLELAPNLAAGQQAVASGAAYLRVHDVTGHQQLTMHP